jgi:hypothetical protein
MDAIKVLLMHLQSAHWIFDTTTADVSEEVAHKGPFGTAGTVGSQMAHLVYDEDMIVNGVLQGKAPLSATTFAGKTGISDPQIAIAPDWPRTVRVNLDQLRTYQKAVFAATDAYLASLKESDLDRSLDMTSMGMGTQNLAWAFGMLIIGHANSLAGEISALKGVQGLKGYPF